MTDVSLALDIDNYLGETPIWSPQDEALWWVNCDQPPELHRWDPANGAHKRWPMPRRIGGFVHKGDGTLLVVLADGLYDFDPEDGALTLRAKSGLPSAILLHECHCDRQGRFWVGGYDSDFHHDRSTANSAFYRLDGDVLTPVIEGITIANGLAFSPDGKTIYTASSPSRDVYASDLDPATGEVSNQRLFATLDGPGQIDGATVDAEGGYWVAGVGGAELRRYRPDGSFDRSITLPCSNPTKPAFGGPDMATLYVTSTKMIIKPDHPGNAANGGLFALTPGEKGVAETPFAG